MLSAADPPPGIGPVRVEALGVVTGVPTPVYGLNFWGRLLSCLG